MKAGGNNNSSNNNSNEKKIEASPKITRRMERLIDEKCNLLSKSGISREGTVHLAQWMKGQFNKQVCASEPIESDEEENSQLQDWSEEDVLRRSTELHLVGDTKKATDENLSDDEQKSASKSTTSDSQVSCMRHLPMSIVTHALFLSFFKITVRSSPINNNNSRSDSISICRQCHKFCKKKSKLSSPGNDSNNNKLRKSPSRQKTVDTSDSSNTIVEDSQASSLMEDAKELRTSQTMITINGIVTESTIKTSQSSPSALQTHHKSTPRMGVRVNFDSKAQNHKKSSSSLSSMCNCECKPKDFEKATLSPDEVKHEIVKILSDVEQIANKMSVTDSSSRSSDSPYSTYSSIRARTLQSKYSFLYNNNHMAAAAKYQPVNIIKETMIGAHDQAPEKAKQIPPVEMNGSSQGDNETENEDDLSLMLVDLAQLNPITSSVPTISVLPPTPDLKTQHHFNPTKDLEITKVNSISIKTESSFDSIDDEDEEPPYMTLKTSLRRFGTLSSLERMPSEDTDEKTVNSSDEENSDGDLKIVENAQTFRTWTSRAGSFLEESRAFIDKYLGRTEHAEYSSIKNGTKDSTIDFDEYETIEGETSGATSGEEVWGTPTSGGENDEMHMFSNGDGNRSVS